jgi:nicotinamide mononucleotide transporter
VDFNQLFLEVSKQAAAISLVEWAAVIFGVVQVVLAWKGRAWNYAAGIISTVLSINLLIGVRLYAEAGLNAYYLIMSIWGWWMWSRPQKRVSTPAFTPVKDWWISGIIVVMGTLLLWGILSHFTSSDVPLWDSWVSATAWAGTWLLTRRRVENWLLLNLSNVFAVPLQWHKGLYLYSLLTVVLFLVACIGYRDWRREAMRAKHARAVA